MPSIRSHVERLEAERPDTALAGWDRFIWRGPGEDAALYKAEAAAEAANRGLIIIRLVDPPQRAPHVEPRSAILGLTGKTGSLGQNCLPLRP